MVDTIKNLLVGGDSLNRPTHAVGRLVYTVPVSPPTRTLLRDITVVNDHASQTEIAAVGIGDTQYLENLLYLKSVAPDTTESYRGLWTMYPGESLYIQCKNYPAGNPAYTSTATGTSAASTTVTTGAWTPVASTRYIIFVANTKTDAPDSVSSWTHAGSAIFPVSVGTVTSGSLGAINDLRFTAYSVTLPANNGTTVATFPAAQAQARMNIVQITNCAVGSTSTPYAWGAPMAIGSTNFDAAAPGASTSGMSLTATSPTSGIMVVGQARSDMSASSTPPSGWTELSDNTGLTAFYPTALSTTTAVIPVNTWSTSTADLRAVIAVECAPNQTAIPRFTVVGAEITD